MRIAAAEATSGPVAWARFVQTRFWNGVRAGLFRPCGACSFPPAISFRGLVGNLVLTRTINSEANEYRGLERVLSSTLSDAIDL